ncbi:MAG TPA: response regulator [Peptococcaceae bacterium]|nr:MAG: Response regulator [Clostridia bacterium 41_269]HBT20702.1 response regulator [Peptococcaceae bacterium]
MFKARIITADSDPDHRKRLKSILTKAGYAVLYEAKNGLQALKAVQQLSPDLAIIDTNLEVYSGLYVAKMLAETDQVPVILISGYTDQKTYREVAGSLAYAHLIKPVDEANLFAAIEITFANYQRVLGLKKEIKKLQQEIQARKLIEKAKGLLMKYQGLSESEAYNKIRTESMNRHTSMARIADTIISYYEIMEKE